MDMGVKITGMNELQRTFGKLPQSVRRKAMRPALKEGAKVIKEIAEFNVLSITAESQVSTGKLASSITTRSLRLYRGMLRYGVQIKKGAVNEDGQRVGLYGSVLEYGKQNQPPRSWLRKAAREGVGAALSAIQNEARNKMDSAVRDAKQ